MTTVLQVLKKARKLIETKGWTQVVEARDEDGNAIDYRDERAICFCALGALWRAADGFESDLAVDARATLASCVHTDHIIDWNDRKRRTKEDVLAAFDRAIKKAEKEAKQ